MNEVYPGIFLIRERGKFGAVKPTENIYVLAGNNGLIFDAGYSKKNDIKSFITEFKEIKSVYAQQKKSFDITRILPSHAHPDHFSGLKKLRKKLGVKIVLTKETAKRIRSKKEFIKHYEADYKNDYFATKVPFKAKIQRSLYKLLYPIIYGISFVKDPDLIIVNEMSEISINDEIWKIVPSPGHSSDHILLYNEKKGILFSGDNIIENITTWLGPPDSNVEDYVKSIQFIQEKLPKLEIIFSAHGKPVINPRKRIEEILSHRNERTQQILKIVQGNAENGISTNGIFHILYPGAKNLFYQVAGGWICLTLKMLEEQKLITREVGKKNVLFYPLNNQ